MIRRIGTEYRYEKKFKQRWKTIPPTSTKRTTTSHLNSLKKKKKPTIYEVGNTGPGTGTQMWWG